MNRNNVIGFRLLPQRGFTLAELLAVIVIMGLMVAAVMPGMVGMNRGSSMRSATSQIRTNLGLARQWAISHRQVTSILFPTSNNDTTGNKGYRAIAAYSTNFIGEWIFLPPGVIIMPSSTVYAGGKTKTLPSVDSKGLVGSIPVINFRPSGQVDWQANLPAPTILLTEGIMNGASVIPKPNSWTNTLSVNTVTGAAR